MARETRQGRDALLGKIQKKLEATGVPYTRTKAAIDIELSSDRKLRLTGGAGVGILQAQALLNGEIDSEMATSVGAVMTRIDRIVQRRAEADLRAEPPFERKPLR